MNPLEKLAGFVHRLRFEDVDKAAPTQVTLCLADSLGCLVYGSRAEHVRKALAAYRPMQVGDGSRIFFESWKAPAPLASFLNGSMIGAMPMTTCTTGPPCIAAASSSRPRWPRWMAARARSAARSSSRRWWPAMRP